MKDSDPIFWIIVSFMFFPVSVLIAPFMAFDKDPQMRGVGRLLCVIWVVILTFLLTGQ